MANKNIRGRIKLASTTVTIAYLEVSTDNGSTFTIVDQMNIPPNATPTIYNFPNYATVDVDNPLVQVRIRAVRQTTISTSTTTTSTTSTTTTTTISSSTSSTTTTSSSTSTTTQPPVTVNAGEDQYLDENVSNTNFYGTVTPPTGVTITSYQWSVVTPDITGVIFSSPNSINTGVSGIPVAARTTFRLTVVDSLGRSFYDDIDVSVAAPSVMYYSGGYLDNKYDPDDANMRTWIYLPQGYDALKPGGFPLIIFMHGMGVNGDQNGDDVTQLIIPGEGLPYFLYNKVYPMQCVVVCPQLHTGQWTLATAQKALNWALAGYNIDPNRAYATGFSSGGAGTFEITYGNPALFAGGIPSNPTWSNVGTPGNGAVVKDIPYLMVHSYNDTQVPPFTDNSTIPALNSILSANPQGIYPPLVLMSWKSPHTSLSWDYYIYNKTLAPFDFETDFLLFHSKDIVVTGNNYVTKAETNLTFYDYSRALVMVNKMPASANKTAYLNRLATVLTNITTNRNHKYYMINLGSSSTFNLYNINNVTSAANGTIVSNLVDVSGGASTKGFTVITNPAGIVTDGLDHDYMGMSRDMFRTSFLVTADNPGQWKFTGLDTTKYYDVKFYHSNKSNQLFNSNNLTGTVIRINGVSSTQSRLEGFNTLFTSDHYNLLPNGSGELVIDATALFNFQQNTPVTYQGNTIAILLKEKTNIANPRSNFGKFNMAATTAASHPDWGTLAGDPTVAVQTAIDPVSGWAINTVTTAATHWNKYNGLFGNDTQAAVGTYSGILPEVVARSGRFNYELYWVDDEQRYNLEIIGTPGMGFPAGKYNMKIFYSTTADFNPTYFNIKMGKSNGFEENTVVTKDNVSNFLSYNGVLKDGETIKIGLYMPGVTWGVAFINAIIVEKVS